MSERGKVVGFQPTNRLAVNHWATNPLTKLLYEGRKISPGTMIEVSNHGILLLIPVLKLYFVFA
jgi:hypothetical protein